jgi:hypothetical protein
VARWTPLVLVFVVALLTGCTARIGGRPVAEEGVSIEEPATAVDALGELTTIDPCSLTDPEVFSPFGTAELATPEALDYCVVSVVPASGTEVTIMVGQLSRLSDRPELAGQKLDDVSAELYTVRISDDPSFCSQGVAFADDDLLLEVSSSVLSGTPTTGCEMVAAGVEQVVATIEDDGVEHRSPEPNSLITVDPCDLVDDATITALPGFAAATRRDDPGGHQCYWSTSAGDERLSLALNFAVGTPPSATSDGSNSDPIAGRPTVSNRFTNVGSAAFCTEETGHIPFTEVADEPGLVEVATVFVRVPAAQLESACQAAKAVATLVWPQLPAA